RTRVTAASARLAKAKEMTVVSEAGTDLRCPIGEFPVTSEYGFVDEPGRWDHWPSGFCFTFPNEGAASGRIVIDKGDILCRKRCTYRALSRSPWKTDLPRRSKAVSMPRCSTST